MTVCPECPPGWGVSTRGQCPSGREISAWSPRWLTMCGLRWYRRSGSAAVRRCCGGRGSERVAEGGVGAAEAGARGCDPGVRRCRERIAAWAKWTSPRRRCCGCGPYRPPHRTEAGCAPAAVSPSLSRTAGSWSWGAAVGWSSVPAVRERPAPGAGPDGHRRQVLDDASVERPSLDSLRTRLATVPFGVPSTFGAPGR